MNFKKKLLTVILIFWSIIAAIASCKSDSLIISKSRYNRESSLLLFTAGYRMPVNNSKILNSGHGLYFEAGINPGRLISKDLLIGFYAGWAFMDKFWATSFNKDFSDDYKASIINSENFSSLDSNIIYSSSDLLKNKKGNSMTMPGCEMKSFHNYSLYYGIMIRLPFKYIPTIKLYKGSTRSHFQGDGNIATKKADFNIFELRRVMYGCELMIINTEQYLNKKKTNSKNKRGGGLSIYYETCDFYNSTLYFYDGTIKKSISLKNYATTSFLQKYKKEVFIGAKLSFYIM